MKNFEDIRLTADGTWCHGDVEITHKRTVDLFWKSVYYQDGSYFLSGEKVPVSIIVEDVAYFVQAMDKKAGSYQLKLSDGRKEKLDIKSLDIGRDHALYCRLQNGAPARFERKVYYQLMKDLKEREGYFGFEVEGLFYPVQSAVDGEAYEQALKDREEKQKQEAKKKKEQAVKEKKASKQKVATKKSESKKAVKKKVSTKKAPKKKAPKKKAVKKSVKKKAAPKKASQKAAVKKKTAKKKASKKALVKKKATKKSSTKKKASKKVAKKKTTKKKVTSKSVKAKTSAKKKAKKKTSKKR